MTKDDIIRMACKAGFSDVWLAVGAGPSNCELPAVIVERFASLVAAHEREAIASMIEDAPPLVEFAQNDKGGCMICGFTPKLAAEAIRARSQS